MTDIAFATYQQSPELFKDDALVKASLEELGISVYPAVWDDESVDWSRFACVVIRSTWDYHHQPERYAKWLSLVASQTVLWNPSEVVLANLNKRYLDELRTRGVQVVPSAYLPLGKEHDLEEVLLAHGWNEAVVKPAVSASAFGTWRTSRATAKADQTRFRAQLRNSELLVQPFVEEVCTLGEWSLIFFDGHYSHAALKRPASGDFRVQSHEGGSAIAANPPNGLIEQATDVITRVGAPLLYARVDGVDQEGAFVLMELEINEPYLFLGFAQDAPWRFAQAIKAKL